ncbi:unnamed protein product, partial [Nesidiocoris tenuis]
FKAGKRERRTVEHFHHSVVRHGSKKAARTAGGVRDSDGIDRSNPLPTRSESEHVRTISTGEFPRGADGYLASLSAAPPLTYSLIVPRGNGRRELLKRGKSQIGRPTLRTRSLYTRRLSFPPVYRPLTAGR